MTITEGERIQLCRKAKGLSQKELGERLGVSGSMIGQYEKGLRKPKLNTLCKISSALNISVLLLLGAEDASGNKLPEYYTDPEAYNLIAGIQAGGHTYQASPPVEPTCFPVDMDARSPEYRIRVAWAKLNEEGKMKAAERIEELAEISRYTHTPEE